jgi:hypothetical protein
MLRRLYMRKRCKFNVRPETKLQKKICVKDATITKQTSGL